MSRCWLHPRSDNTIHAETDEAREHAISMRLLKSRAVVTNPQNYCKHGCYAGDKAGFHSCCYCDGSEVRCYEREGS